MEEALDRFIEASVLYLQIASDTMVTGFTEQMIFTSSWMS
jgi:hypothetical protein